MLGRIPDVKGLEYDAVIVMGVNEAFSDTLFNKKLLYMATTRAKHYLAIHWFGRQSPILGSISDRGVNRYRGLGGDRAGESTDCVVVPGIRDSKARCGVRAGVYATVGVWSLTTAIACRKLLCIINLVFSAQARSHFLIRWVGTA